MTEDRTKNTNIVCLVVVYLRIFMRNNNYSKFKETKFQIDTLYMKFMGQERGISQMIKFLEDGHPKAIEKEYQKTKEELQRFYEAKKKMKD